MELAEADIAVIRPLCDGLSIAKEGGRDYLRLTQLRLPKGCSPEAVDALLCLSERDGYATRLFFGASISGPKGLNWNAQGTAILGEQWWAFSWREPARSSVAEILDNHLKPMRQVA